MYSKLSPSIYALLTIIAFLYPSYSDAMLNAVASPKFSQHVGQIIQFRPSHDYTTEHQFQYRIIGTNNNIMHIARDWGKANWDWDTSGYDQGRYIIQLRSRLVNNMSSIHEVAYNALELTNHVPVTRLGLTTNPMIEIHAGGEVAVVPIAYVGNIFADGNNNLNLEYRYYLVHPDRTFQHLTDWQSDKTLVWNTAGFETGSYRIGVRVRKRNAGVTTYENAHSIHYTLSDTSTISSLELSLSNIKSPQTIGAVVDIFADSKTESNDTLVEYRYMIRPHTRVSLEILRDWSVDPSYSWDTVTYEPGLYIIQVQARDQSASSNSIITDTTGFRLYNLSFKDVTHTAGISYEGESWGGAWGDLNSDGLPDIWFTNHRQAPSLYLNNGNGTFADVTDSNLLTKSRTDAHGTAWADFDNDGDQDLIQVAGGGQGIRNTNPGHWNYLYVNNNGYLENESDLRGVTYAEARGRGATWHDWNKDGKLDLFLTTHNSSHDPGNKLFLQLDGGIFSDQSLQLNIPDHQLGGFAIPSRNHSGDIYSIFVSGDRFPKAIYPDINSSETLLLNNSYGSVSDVSISDLNGDGIVDLYLARKNSKRHDYQFNDDGSLSYLLGTFSKGTDNGISFKSNGSTTFYFVLSAQRASGLFIGEEGLNPNIFDNTINHQDVRFSVTLDPSDQRVWGLRDRNLTTYGVYVGYNAADDCWTIVTNNNDHGSFSTVFGIVSSEAISDIEEINFEIETQVNDIILFGDENGVFTDSDISLSTGSTSVSVATADFDNDMDVDVYTVHSRRIYNRPNTFLINLGNGRFQRMLQTGRLGEDSDRGVGDTVITADYDMDGFIDILITNGKGEPPFNNGPRQLFMNQGNTNNWVEIDLEGVISNKDGIETVVYARTPDGNLQVREQNGGIHAKGQNHQRVHFGLGRNNIVNIEVQWPSGITQHVNRVDANQLIVIQEAIDL